MNRQAWADALTAAGVLVAVVAVVVLAVAGAMGAALPAWACAACGLGGGAVGWAIATPRRP